MQKLFFILYDLVLALWTGGIFLFTFIVTPVIFKSYGRDMAGEIVGKLFPGYFMYNLVLSALAFLSFFFIQSGLSKAVYRTSLLLIVAAVVINLYVTYKIHPETRKVKGKIHSFEEVPPDSPLRAKFRKLHAVSATLNLLLLADGITLLVISRIARS
jgi:uncharacterized membrane protein